jgi:hypothetical protein
LATTKNETSATQSNNTEYRAYQKTVHVTNALQTIRQEVRKNQALLSVVIKESRGFTLLK